MILLTVEHAPETARCVGRNASERLVGDAEEVELGTQRTNGLGQCAARVTIGPFEQAIGDHVHVVLQLVGQARRFDGELIAHDTTLDVVIEQDGDDRVFEAGNDDDVVDELVLVAPHLDEARAQCLDLDLADLVHDQDLEVGPLFAIEVAVERNITTDLGSIGITIEVNVLDAREFQVSVSTADEQSNGPRGLGLEQAVPALVAESLQVLADLGARERPEALDAGQQRQLVRDRALQVVDGLPGVRATPQARRLMLDLVPDLHPELRGGVVPPKVRFPFLWTHACVSLALSSPMLDPRSGLTRSRRLCR